MLSNWLQLVLKGILLLLLLLLCHRNCVKGIMIRRKRSWEQRPRKLQYPLLTSLSVPTSLAYSECLNYQVNSSTIYLESGSYALGDNGGKTTILVILCSSKICYSPSFQSLPSWRKFSSFSPNSVIYNFNSQYWWWLRCKQFKDVVCL